jgi:hypothetical protein
MESQVIPTGPEPVLRPAGTQIARTTLPDGTEVWHVPSPRRGNGMVFMGGFWCAFVALFTAAIVYKLLTGRPIQGNMPHRMWVPFLGVFWAVGIGLLYVGLRQKYATHLLAIGPDEVVLTRRLFGRETTKSLARPEVQEVALVEFYRQRYEPVRGVEIRAAAGKLRFGSSLTKDEKRWLVHGIHEAMFAPGAGVLQGAPQEHFELAVPEARKQAAYVAVVLVLFGGAMMAVGWWSWKRWNDLPVELLIVWMLISGTVVARAAGQLFQLWLNAGRETRIEGTASEVAIRVYDRAGRLLKSEVFARNAVRDVRCAESGKSNGQATQAFEIVTGARGHRVRAWVDAGQASVFVRQVRAALGLPLQAPDEI